MPKRKKYPKLPTGWGTIRFLGKNRTNRYAVHPPAKECDEKGNYIRPKALCYVDDWYVGFAVLNSYRAGTYKPGDEIYLRDLKAVSEGDLDAFCAKLLKDYSSIATSSALMHEKTFSEVYEEFTEWRFGAHAAKVLSNQAYRSQKAAYGHLSALYTRSFKQLRLKDFQDCLNTCDRKKSTLENIISLIRQLYKYAIQHDLCEKSYATGLIIPSSAEDDEHGVPFTEDELRTLWANQDDPIVEMILIMCYSGFRITAYIDMETNLEKGYFRGGLKTAAGKDRIVPIHSGIQALVEKRIKRDGALLDCSDQTFRKWMYKKLATLGMERHTPHDCRHTFSALCEKYEVKETDRKRMLGHSLNGDVTNGVYGHRTLEELRTELEKVKLPP